MVKSCQNMAIPQQRWVPNGSPPPEARGKVRFSMTRAAGPEGALLLWLATGKSRDSEAAFLHGFPLDSGNIWGFP